MRIFLSSLLVFKDIFNCTHLKETFEQCSQLNKFEPRYVYSHNYD